MDKQNPESKTIEIEKVEAFLIAFVPIALFGKGKKKIKEVTEKIIKAFHEFIK